MVCNRCKLKVHDILCNLKVSHKEPELGSVWLLEDISSEKHEMIRAELFKANLELIEKNQVILVERIKNTITELIHHTTGRINTNFSDYLSLQLKYDYTYLANVFSATERTTIEQYMIRHKIERVKELLGYGELNLSQIADVMHYSSVGHLSNQFKKITGFTSSHYKKTINHRLSNLENL